MYRTSKQSLHDAAKALREVDQELKRLKEELIVTEILLTRCRQAAASAKEHKEKCSHNFVVKRDRILWLKRMLGGVDICKEREERENIAKLYRLFAAASDEELDDRLELLAGSSMMWLHIYHNRPLELQGIQDTKYREELVQANAEIGYLMEDCRRADASYLHEDCELTKAEGIYSTRQQFLTTVEARKERSKEQLLRAAEWYAASLPSAFW